MTEVGEGAYVLSNNEPGEMYLCNPRCLAIWSLQRATHPNTPATMLDCLWSLRLPDGTERQFNGLNALARWATPNAIGSVDNAVQPS
jgi:hypothetical protein